MFQQAQIKLIAALFIFIFIFSGCDQKSTLYAHPLPECYTIDRIEGDYMVLLSGDHEKIVPVIDGAKEGAELVVTPTKKVVREDQKLKKEILKLQQELTTEMVAMKL